MAKSALVFVRPHLLEIEHQRNGGDNFHAKVTHINAAGPLVKVDLVTDWGDPVHVELSHGRYLSLGLKREDEVFVRPRKEGFLLSRKEELIESLEIAANRLFTLARALLKTIVIKFS